MLFAMVKCNTNYKLVPTSSTFKLYVYSVFATIKVVKASCEVVNCKSLILQVDSQFRVCKL